MFLFWGCPLQTYIKDCLPHNKKDTIFYCFYSGYSHSSVRSLCIFNYILLFFRSKVVYVQCQDRKVIVQTESKPIVSLKDTVVQIQFKIHSIISYQSP